MMLFQNYKMAVGGPLFGGATTRSTSKSLVEFRAGKMTLNASTKMVSPDKRKGLVSVYQSDDQLMHLTWKDRGTGTLEDDLIIFPDDCEFLAVPACTTGRVFVLKFKTSNKRMFFWMQEPKTDKDEEFCKKVNESLNQLPSSSSFSSGRSGAAGLGGVLPAGLDFNNLGDSELQNLLNNMSQSQLMQLFGTSLGGAGGGNMQGLASLLGSSGGRSRQAAGTGRTRPTPVETPAVAATPEAVPAAGAANPNIQLSDLQSILSNIQVPPGGEGIGAGGPAVDMSSALTLETLQPILSNPEFLEKVKDFVPKDESAGKDVSAEDLKGTVLSPQFKQAVSMFSMALQSGQLGPLVREFGLGDLAAAAAAQGDMLSFVQALQKDAGAGDTETKKKDDEPEDMALD
ncbi:proteasomal ubiquitin receptor ADRM1 [Eurytemora carolleeae]|uniref:proteasomal ubiquitin receptor ADRM1 n=1 Tax=Eurytemora carolleeae TaxID=1294199 RepID=UPI000C79336D|nr:proteasomal ubiquitin receptor ADRM1 [Eurytemora carolleeae]|eukprot:XP_023342375.1 proteasomal ubiquitin receptor ADRM1-like [Eurytemora affinis]